MASTSARRGGSSKAYMYSLSVPINAHQHAERAVDEVLTFPHSCDTPGGLENSSCKSPSVFEEYIDAKGFRRKMLMILDLFSTVELPSCFHRRIHHFISSPLASFLFGAGNGIHSLGHVYSTLYATCSLFFPNQSSLESFWT